MASLNVAIIGAGVAGPTLAILLKKAGIESTIYDGRARDHPDRGSIVITANGLRVLEHMGLLEQVQRLGYAHDSLTILNLKGEVTGHFMYGGQELYGLDAQRLYRSSLRGILLAEAHKLAIDIKYDMRCTSVEQEAEDHVTIRFQNGELVEADFVIGSDGIYSYVKEHVAPGIAPTFKGQIGVWALAERKAWHNPEADEYARMILSNSGAFVVTPADGSQNHVLFFATIQTHDRSVQEWRELERDKERLKSMLSFPFTTDSWPPDVQKLVTDTPAESFFFWPFRAASCERFVSKLGRIILIGDAAHAMPPSAGQGASMALEDAETLAITLSRVAYEYGILTPEAFAPLRQWESQRKKRIDQVCERTKRSSDMRKTNGTVDLQGRKEARAAQSQDNLEWLYSYDCRSFDLD